MTEERTASAADEMGAVLVRTICLLEPFFIFMVAYKIYAENAEEMLGGNLKWWRGKTEQAFQRIAAADEKHEFTIEEMEIILKNTVYVLRPYLVYMVMYELYGPDAERNFGPDLQRWRSLSELAFRQIEGFEVFF